MLSHCQVTTKATSCHHTYTEPLSGDHQGNVMPSHLYWTTVRWPPRQRHALTPTLNHCQVTTKATSCHHTYTEPLSGDHQGNVMPSHLHWTTVRWPPRQRHAITPTLNHCQVTTKATSCHHTYTEPLSGDHQGNVMPSHLYWATVRWPPRQRHAITPILSHCQVTTKATSCHHTYTEPLSGDHQGNVMPSHLYWTTVRWPPRQRHALTPTLNHCQVTTKATSCPHTYTEPLSGDHQGNVMPSHLYWTTVRWPPRQRHAITLILNHCQVTTKATSCHHTYTEPLSGDHQGNVMPSHLYWTTVRWPPRQRHAITPILNHCQVTTKATSCHHTYTEPLSGDHQGNVMPSHLHWTTVRWPPRQRHAITPTLNHCQVTTKATSCHHTYTEPLSGDHQGNVMPSHLYWTTVRWPPRQRHAITPILNHCQVTTKATSCPHTYTEPLSGDHQGNVMPSHLYWTTVRWPPRQRHAITPILNHCQVTTKATSCHHTYTEPLSGDHQGNVMPSHLYWTTVRWPPRQRHALTPILNHCQVTTKATSCPHTYTEPLSGDHQGNVMPSHLHWTTVRWPPRQRHAITPILNHCQVTTKATSCPHTYTEPLSGDHQGNVMPSHLYWATVRWPPRQRHAITPILNHCQVTTKATSCPHTYTEPLSGDHQGNVMPSHLYWATVRWPPRQRHAITPILNHCQVTTKATSCHHTYTEPLSGDHQGNVMPPHLYWTTVRWPPRQRHALTPILNHCQVTTKATSCHHTYTEPLSGDHQGNVMPSHLYWTTVRWPPRQRHATTPILNHCQVTTKATSCHHTYTEPLSGDHQGNVMPSHLYWTTVRWPPRQRHAITPILNHCQVTTKATSCHHTYTEPVSGDHQGNVMPSHLYWTSVRWPPRQRHAITPILSHCQVTTKATSCHHTYTEPLSGDHQGNVMPPHLYWTTVRWPPRQRHALTPILNHCQVTTKATSCPHTYTEPLSGDHQGNVMPSHLHWTTVRWPPRQRHALTPILMKIWRQHQRFCQPANIFSQAFVFYVTSMKEYS